MGVNRMIRIIAVFFILSFTSVGDRYCVSRAQTSECDKKITLSERSASLRKGDFEILKSYCTDDGKCIVIAYSKAETFNRDGMNLIATEISVRYRDSKVVNVSLFDDREMASSYAQGIGDPRELASDRRAWFLKFDGKEFLLFYPDRERKQEVERVDPIRCGD